MGDVSPIESLAFHDESLGPDHLLSRDEFDGHTEHGAVDGVFKPFLVNSRHAVAGAENDVDEVLVMKRLGEPVRKGGFDFAAHLLEHPERLLVVVFPYENIEVLGMPFNPCIPGE